MPKSIFTLSENVALLKVVENILHAKAQRIRMPAFKVCGQRHVKRFDFEHWIEGHKALVEANAAKGGANE